MKKRTKKLRIAKETLYLLQDLQGGDLGPADLLAVRGGVSVRTECGSCPASACHPTFCGC